MKKYRMICKACNAVYRESEDISGMPAKCPSCGEVRMAVEPISEAELSDVEYDLFVTNKRNGITKHAGVILKADTWQNNSTSQIKDIFIDKIAGALAELLKNPENVNMLIENKEE